MGRKWKQWQIKIIVVSDWSHEIKRRLLLGRKAMTNLDSVLKSRSITLPTKVCLVTATVFPVVLYGCESWTIKKAEHHRIDAFELWCLRRLLRVPSTGRRSNQSVLEEINPEYSLEGLMLKLKLQYFGPLCKELTHWKRLWCWEQRKAGGEDEMVWWHHQLSGHEFGQTLGDSEGQRSLSSPWGRKDSDATEWLNTSVRKRAPWYKDTRFSLTLKSEFPPPALVPIQEAAVWF